MKNSLLLLAFTIAWAGVFAQRNSSLPMEWKKPTRPVVCYAAQGDANTYIAPPKEFLEWRNNPSARTKTADIQVTYENFTPEAQQAFQAAVDIWETLISSPVPIRIYARWVNLATNVLGSATPATYYANFDEAQKRNVWYPVALAEKVARRELNLSTEPDIIASFNSSNSSWYFGTTGTPGPGKYDLVTVVLHEIGHGLGITHSYEVDGANGQIIDLFSPAPVSFDSFIENGTGQSLHRNFTAPSTQLGTQLTSGDLYFNSKLVLAKNNGNKAKVYAPATYSAGSSIAHLDEDTFGAGSKNSLMTPFINPVEVIHNPGNVTMAILKDMGWNDVTIQHTKIPNTEVVNADFTVTCNIASDTAFVASSLKLNYSLDKGATFTTVTMTAGTNANEYKATIPKPTGASQKYHYFITVEDVAQRTYANRGSIYTQGKSTVQQRLWDFTSGPDATPPAIVHSPTAFVKKTDSQWKLTAAVSDNIGVGSAVVEYFINSNSQTIAMSNTKDSTFEASIALALSTGDKLKYRIKATDNSVAQNVKYAPETGYYDVNVVTLAATQDTYTNNFNTTTTDFFGDAQFSITKPTGFNDNAIHTVHPYPDGSDTNKESNYVYQLGVPIRLKDGGAILKFEEIVLVEPGENGAAFGTAEFFDYVIVEGSKDGGVTWKKLIDGYDSRAQAEWLAKWNSSSDNATPAANSTGAGDQTLFKTRTINMLNNTGFAAGDEIVIRFRLFADALAHGWGWAIDNLKIQVDDIPPTMLHTHTDFLASNASVFSISTKATDASGLQSLTFEYGVNGGTVTSTPAVITTGVDQYTLDITLTGSGIKAGDEIQYRLKAKDNVGNETILPASGFFKVAVLDFTTTVTSYTSDFNTSNTDFAGNYFSQKTPSGFSNGAITSENPYPVGFGLTGSSNFSYTLKKPVVISSTNPYMMFSEMLIAEYAGLAIKDYAIVEGSKDQGATWQTLVDAYSSNSFAEWKSAFDNGASGNSLLYKTRTIDLTKSGKFKAGDAVLIRFRLFSDATLNGWGWVIDNLSIQGPITGIEEKSTGIQLEVYPNPVAESSLRVAVDGLTAPEASISFVSAQGAIIRSEISSVENGRMEREYNINDWANGVYLIRVQSGGQLLTKKVIKAQ